MDLRDQTWRDLDPAAAALADLLRTAPRVYPRSVVCAECGQDMLRCRQGHGDGCGWWRTPDGITAGRPDPLHDARSRNRILYPAANDWRDDPGARHPER